MAIGLAACLWFGVDHRRGDDASMVKTVIGVIFGIAFLCAILAVAIGNVKLSRATRIWLL